MIIIINKSDTDYDDDDSSDTDYDDDDSSDTDYNDDDSSDTYCFRNVTLQQL